MNPRIAIAVAADYNGRWANQVVSDAGRVAAGVGKAGQQAAQSMQAANLNTANLAAQFNDIGVMLASGQSPLLLALQQGTQVAQALGPVGVGGAAKALGAAFMSVISPLNLITIGTIAVGAAAVQWLMGLNQEAPKAEDALKRHRDQLAGILEGYDAAKVASESYLDSASKLPEGVVLSDLNKSLSDQAKAIEAQQSKVDAFNRTVADSIGFFEHFRSVADAMGSGSDALEFSQQLVQSMADLNITTASTVEDLEAAMTAARKLFNTTDDSGLKDVASQAYELAAGLRLGALQAKAMVAAIAAMSFPALPAGYTDAMATLGDLATPAMTERDKAKAALNTGLSGAQDAITRRAIEQKYQAAMAQIDAEEAAAKAGSGGKGGVGGGATKSAGGKAIEAMLDVMKETRSEAQKLADTISSSLATSVTGFFSTIRSGGDAMGYLANQLGSVADQLLNNALQSLFGSLFGGFNLGGGIKSIGGSLGSTGGGALSRLPFGPPKAAGGPVSAGIVYPVGEMGPELFMPQSAGTIIPNHKIGGGAPSGGATTVRIELGEGLVGKVLDRAGRQTVQIVQSITPGMIKSEAPAAVAAARRDGRI